MAVDPVYDRCRRLSRQELRLLATHALTRLPAEAQVREAGLIRAIGAIFGLHGTAAEKSWARDWLLPLLNHPEEKIRRYAILALPKLHAGSVEEAALLRLYQTSALPRERLQVASALEKIGGSLTLSWLAQQPEPHPLNTARLRANIARQNNHATHQLHALIPLWRGLRIHLRCRRGLEYFLRQELQASTELVERFQFLQEARGLIALHPRAAFTLHDLLGFRCNISFSFVLGKIASDASPPDTATLARTITGPVCRHILQHSHQGTPRYRLETSSLRTTRKWLQEVADHVHQLWPDLLNDSRSAPWAIELHPAPGGHSVELRPRFSPDPRFAWRVADHPAASHPPLAAALALWAKTRTPSPASVRIWDPFCGSGLELIEAARLYPGASLYGTDLNPAALEACRTNLNAAKLSHRSVQLTACDFRNFTASGLSPGSLTHIITNPPLGRRLRIPGLRTLIQNLFETAATVLEPGGTLTLANPIRLMAAPAGLRLIERRWADLGGFLCRLELWQRSPGQ